jgi:outer membrane protein assembly factor BamB
VESLTEADPRTVGEFRLLARLGSGGMGTVFLATSPAGRMVAVKIIHADLDRDPAFVSRFRSEVSAARKISGLYTAAVVAAGIDTSPLWLATAFVPGPSLDDIVTRRGPLPVAAVWRLAAGLAEALDAIHSAGLVHRDLKPENVLLALDGPRVIDFGISRALTDKRLTRTGMVVGTPAYMSPEHVEGLATGPQGDVFSLGCVLAFAATGTSPFNLPGAPTAAVFNRVVRAEPELGAVPAEVRELITACLAKDPDQRPDLAQVAALGTAQTKNLNLSLTAFWPAGVAQAIAAQQATAAAQARGLEVTSQQRVRSGPDKSRLAASAARQDSLAEAALLPAPAAPGQHAAGAVIASAPGGSTHATGGARRLSRRGLLIGAGVAGVSLIGGLAADRALAPGSSPFGAGPATGSGAGRNAARGRAAPGRGPKGAQAGSGGSARRGAAKTTGDHTQAAAPDAAGLSPGQQVWAFPTSDPVDANPIVVGGIAYVASRDNHLYAVDVKTGQPAWSYAADNISAAPTYAAGYICVASAAGRFYAINARTGALAWQLTTSSAPQYIRGWATSGTAVIMPAGEALRAYDVGTGAAGIEFAAPAGFTGILAAGGPDVIYALDHAGTVHAINVPNGVTLWRSPVLNSSPGIGMVAAGSTVYAGTTNGMLYSLNASTGKVNWAYQAGHDLHSEPVAGYGNVYVNDIGGFLHAIAAPDAKPLWTYGTGGSGSIGPAVAGSQVYACTSHSLQSLNAATGAPGWSFTPPGTASFNSTPTVADGVVYVGCDDNNLYAIMA